MATPSTTTNEDDLGIIGASQPICQLRSIIRRAATTIAPVLITGETGTGKELVARALHRLSSRSAGPILCVNCGALSSELLLSELFGHAKGAFTGAIEAHKGKFESADGGVLFLDEINSAGLDLQVKLLRVLQDKVVTPVGSNIDINVDVRVIAASNQDLDMEVKGGRFRQDLLYRLNVFPIRVAPLRERGDDVIVLADYFLDRYCKEEKRSFSGLSEASCRVLVRHNWPGNVRELDHVIHRAVVMADQCGDNVPIEISPDYVGSNAPPSSLGEEDSIADRVFDALLRNELPLEGMLKGDKEIGETAELIFRGIDAGLSRYLESVAGQDLLSRNVKKGVILARMGLSDRSSGNKSIFAARLRKTIDEVFGRHA